jgi:hypothetical protein
MSFIIDWTWWLSAVAVGLIGAFLVDAWRDPSGKSTRRSVYQPITGPE